MSDASIDTIWAEHRPYLVDLAFRMLGNIHSAEDVVQEAFTRLLRVDRDEIDEIRGWLVVVVSRLCLDQLRAASTRRESASEELDLHEPVAPQDPADRVTLDASVSLALLVVMERLSPPERAVFVLHDVFQFPFEAVAGIVGRSTTACRQLASRARRRIEAATGPARFAADTSEHNLIATEFIAACAGRDLSALTRLLDPNVGGEVDLGPRFPARPPLRGRDMVCEGLLTFFGPDSGTTLVSQPVNGQPGVLAFRDRRLAAIIMLDVRDGQICDIHAIGDRDKLATVESRINPTNSP